MQNYINRFIETLLLNKCQTDLAKMLKLGFLLSKEKHQVLYLQFFPIFKVV